MSVKAKKILILVSFFFFTIFFAYFFNFLLLKKTKEIISQILIFQEKLLETDKKLENLEAFKKEKAKNKENFEFFKEVFVDKEFPIAFINFLEETAQSLNLSQEISLGKNEKGSEKDYLSFQIKLSGSSQGLLHFLEKIENCKYLIQIERVNFFKDKKSEDENLSESLKLVVFLKVKTK